MPEANGAQETVPVVPLKPADSTVTVGKDPEPKPDPVPPEPPKPAEPEKPKAEVAAANRFAALKRLEAKARSDKAEAERIRGEVAKAQAAVQAQQARIDRMRESPLDALAAAGMTYDQITDAVLRAKDGAVLPTPTTAAVQQVRDELAELRRAQEEAAKARAETERLQQERTIVQYQAQVRRDVEAQAEAFELVNLTGAHGQVWEAISQHYRRTGEVLQTADAAKQVEAALEAQIRMLLTKGKKLATIVKQPAAPAPAPTNGNGAETTKPAPTLSAGLASAQPQHEAISEQDRVRRAIEAMKAARKIT